LDCAHLLNFSLSEHWNNLHLCNITTVTITERDDRFVHRKCGMHVVVEIISFSGTSCIYYYYYCYSCWRRTCALRDRFSFVRPTKQRQKLRKTRERALLICTQVKHHRSAQLWHNCRLQLWRFRYLILLCKTILIIITTIRTCATSRQKPAKQKSPESGI